MHFSLQSVYLLYFSAKAFMTLRCIVSMLLTGNEYLLLLGLGSSDGLMSSGEVSDSPLAITSISKQKQDKVRIKVL